MDFEKPAAPERVRHTPLVVAVDYLTAMPHRASSTTLPLLPLYDPRVLTVHYDISPDPLRRAVGHTQASLCDRPCPPLLSPTG